MFGGQNEVFGGQKKVWGSKKSAWGSEKSVAIIFDQNMSGKLGRKWS